jgi:hypothetical protein
MIARIEGWKEGHGKARGRAETDPALGEAHKLFDEISKMLTEMRRELLGRGKQQRGGRHVSESARDDRLLPAA